MPEPPPTASSAEPSRGSVWLPLAVIVLAGYGLFQLYGFFSRSEEEASPPEAIERPLAVLDLQGLTGTDQPVVLSQIQGQVTLINFWATWCPSCLIEFPHLIELQGRLRDRSDFRLLSVVSGVQNERDAKEARQATEAYLKKIDATIPTYVDLKGDTHRAVLELLAIPGPSGKTYPPSFSLPTSVLVDRRGIVRKIWVGFSPAMPEQMRSLIGNLLDEQESPHR